MRHELQEDAKLQTAPGRRQQAQTEPGHRCRRQQAHHNIASQTHQPARLGSANRIERHGASEEQPEADSPCERRADH